MKKLLLIPLLLIAAHANAGFEFPTDGGAAVYQCVEVVDGSDVLISSHALEKNAIASCFNAWLAKQEGVYEIDVNYRIRISVDLATQEQLTLSWTPPDTYADGTPLAAEDIEGYRVYAGDALKVETLDTHTKVDAGDCYTATALAGGLESDRSNEVCQ